MLKKILRGADSYNVVYIEIVRYGSLFLDRLLNEGNFRMQINRLCRDLYRSSDGRLRKFCTPFNYVNKYSTIYRDYILGFY